MGVNFKVNTALNSAPDSCITRINSHSGRVGHRSFSGSNQTRHRVVKVYCIVNLKYTCMTITSSVTPTAPATDEVLTYH